MRRELWTDRHTRGSPRSFISFMRPGCDSIILPDTIKDAMVLFMPYIHWETQEKQTKLEYFSLFKFIADLEPSMLHSFLSQLATENHELLRYPKTPPSLQRIHLTLNRYSTAVSDPKTNWRRLRDNFFRRKILSQCKESSSDLDLDLIELYASNEPTSHPLHPRRTLDQYFYYTLNNTSRRNQDQVVARYGRREGKKQPIVLMVDQLWLWRLDNVVVSCFPQRRECGKDDPDRYDTTDIFENILSSLAKSPINIPGKNRPMNLILRIIRECSSTFFDPTKNLDDDFKFLDIFNNSINRVADEEVNCYEQFIDTLKTSSHHHDRMPIDTEFYLLREIKDIIEELRMMRQVSDEQQAVLSSLGQKLSTLSQSSEEDPLKGAGALYNKGERYIAKIDRMQREAERTNNSINSLMDLRQRHATLSEAQATGRQGNTIMVFTVVTILFLPASFMASFFALPVAQFSRVQPDADIMDLTYIVRWLLVFTVPVAVFFISIAFYINEVLAFLSRGRISGIFRGREFPATSMRLAIDEDGQSMGDDTMSESKLGPDEESIWPVRHRKGFTIRYRRKRKPTSRPMSDEP
ncbi:hypothetical protein BJX63DRAFT_426163 [Aspergillus granulosus]|uniref:Ankyrin repeat protein n=1 Tax=Aspergillus granulosus TaxID=176169 RepID=A0ABR4GTU5_9EURO